MKNLKRVLALLLALCMCLTVVSAEEVTEERDHNNNYVNVTDPAYTEIVEAAANDRLTWELDGSTLWIGGKGIIKPIQSAEEQPWAAVREQIEIVRFVEGSELLLDDIAYWFSGCVNLTYADLPGFVFVIGTDAFRNCGKLEELGFYHIIEPPEVADSAFSCTNGTDLTIITKDNAVATGLTRVNWSERTAEVLDLSQYGEDVAFTLTATDRHAVFSRQRVDAFRENEVTCTQSARQSKDATDLVLDGEPRFIRRLTPLECERLQGFPDQWTNIPGARDSPRYKALGNSVAIPCVEFLMQGIAYVLSGRL